MPRRTLPSALAPLAAGVLAALTFVACATGASPSSSPASSASRPPPPVPATPPPSVQPTAAATLTPSDDDLVATAPVQEIPGQVDTEWGRIWDELPTGFPTSTVGRSSQVEPDVPASGAHEIDLPASEVAPAMQAALEGARFSTLSMSGPFEDGSVIIESADFDSPGCLVQTTIAALGERSRVTILYGAACPFPLE